MKICPHCECNLLISNFYIRSTGKPSTYCKKCTSIQALARQRGLKQKAVDYMGGKCSSCGYSKTLAALEFHHLDPKEKDFSISSQGQRSFQNIKKELDKCILLCANCHREVHAGEEVVWSPKKSTSMPDIPLDSYHKPLVSTKGIYPADEELKEMVWKYPSFHLAKVFKVSDVALGKYLKRRGISKPPRGYWSSTKK